ncbi:MAG: lytic transglycosylase domain-containing protein [Holosporales bacterium]|nr:lytic transglycosylase domain-containing protein [Holosporales bacterium]
MTFYLPAKKLKKFLETLTLVGLLYCPFLSQTQANFASPPIKDIQRCLTLLERVESLYGIPPQLLKAIALTESGRMQGDRFVPWPWTINVNGKGYFYPTKAEAIKAVKNFQKKGIRSIDVGCMQINLMHHPKAFSSLEEAFDPEANIRYGGEFLVKLRENNKGIWKQAVGFYHSSRPQFYEPYRQRVIKTWYKNRKKKYPFALDFTKRQRSSFWQSAHQKYMQKSIKLNKERHLVFHDESRMSQISGRMETKKVPALKSLGGAALKMLYMAKTPLSPTPRLRKIKNRLKDSTSSRNFEPPIRKIPPLRASYQTIQKNLKSVPIILAYKNQNIS